MASNPDDIARSVAQQNAYGGIYSTQYADAQKASRANQIAREIGLPADVVESDFPNVAADHRVQQGQMLAATTPQAATWLSDPRNAAAVSNDYASLTPVAAAASKTSPDQGGGVLSSIGHFFGDVGSSMWNQTKLSAGRLETLGGRMMSGMGNNLSLVASALPAAAPAALIGKFFGTPVKQQGQALVAHTPTETEGEKYWNDWHYSDLWHNPVNFAKKVVPSTIYSIANSVPAIVETAVGKGAPLAADITEQTAEARARNNGRADPNAWDYALAVPAGIVSAALFRHARVADVGSAVEAGSGSILKSLGETAVRDAALGGAQAGVQYTGESVGTGHGFHLSELASRSAEAAMANATMGVAIHGVGSAIMAPVRAMRDVAVARDGADYVDTVMDAAVQSKSRTQSPQEFQSFIDAHVKDSPAENMFIPGEAISALFQTAEGDPSPRRIEQDPFWSKYAQQVDDATRMGGDVVVPLSDLATHLPGTGDWNQLRDQVRFNPGGMSLAEAKEYATQKAPEDIEKAVTELSARMDQEAGGLAATRKAYQLYRDMGMSHTEAATAGVLQGSWIKRVNEVENAKREAAGEATLTPAEEWDRRNISGMKTTEAGQAKAAAQTDTLNQTARGNISIERDEKGNPKAAIIRAFESSNFSTAVHEMGHYWIEDLRARALRKDATEQERADWSTAKDWFGGLGHAVDEKEMIPEHAHEFWARGVERYIMEGKAPSHELNGVFARMAQWMRKLYQSVTALNAPISPEIRDVMDRLLASDSEIEAARGDMKMNPLEGAEALMTEAERAAYHNIASESREQAYQSLLERVMETVKNRRTREYNAQKKELRDDVTSQIDQQPVYRALKTLRKGEDGEKVKLPKQWLIDNYGEDAPGKMPKGIDPLFADEGMDPEEIASHAGFDSADQMVHALMDHAARKAEMKAGGDNRSPRQADIEEGLKARIEQDIPDPYHDLETEARASIATDKAGDLMSMEARALSRKTGQRPAPWDLAKKWAQGHLQDQTTRDALTGAALARYARSVAKAGKLTEEALMKGDFEQALIHKNQQILNAALLQEAKRVKEQVETASRKMKRIANARTMPSIDQDYLDQAHALLEQVRMTNETGVRVGKIKSFEKWYTDQVAEGREPIVPIEYSRLLGTVHWTSLKVGDLLELNDVVSQIVNIGRLKQTLLDGKGRRDFDGAVGELVERQKENTVPRKQSDLNNPFNSMTERVKSRFRSFDAVNLKFEQLMNFMDNALPNGPWQRMLMNPLSAAQAKQSRILRPLLEDLNASIKAVPKDVVKGWTREVDTPELKNWAVPQTDPRFGQPWRFTKDQILAMALNLGNDGNKQRLLDGYRFEEADVRAVLDRHLTEHDWKFVQSVFDTVGKLWPHIEELERDVNGFAPDKVEATPIETRHGTFEGGYFPAIYDPLYSSRADVDEMRKLTGGGFFSVNTRAGATNERAEAVMNRPLLLSLSVVTRHLNEVVHDLAFREPAGQVKRLLKDDRIRQAITDLMGPEFYKKSLDYLENVAFPNVADSKQDQTIVAFARALNKRITTAGLGFRISTILQQPTAFSNTMAEVGNVRYGQFFAKYLQHPMQAWEQVSGLSEEMRERAHNLDANINAMYEEHSKNTLVMGPSKIAQLAYKGIAMTDLLITIPGWMAAFDKATTDLKMNDDDAVHYADMVIRKTQGAGSPKDQAAIQRTIWMKAFNPFFSYWSAHYNQLRSIGHEARRVRDADHVFNLTNRFILAAILPMAIQGWFFGGPQGQDEGDLHYLLKQIVVGNLGAIPGMNALTSHLAYGYDYKVSPWTRFAESAFKTGEDVKQAYKHGQGDGDAPKSWVKDSFDSFAYFSGQPVSQMGASLQGLYDYSTGKAHPENVGEWAELVTKGKVPQHDR